MKKTELQLKTKFFGRISTMGKDKVIVYVPQALHKEVLEKYKGRNIRITLEDAEE